MSTLGPLRCEHGIEGHCNRCERNAKREADKAAAVAELQAEIKKLRANLRHIANDCGPGCAAIADENAQLRAEVAALRDKEDRTDAEPTG